MSYKVIIPTAGLGSRLEKLTRNINKSLISVDHKPVLGHQIKKFPKGCEFVIALGFKGQLVKEYLSWFIQKLNLFLNLLNLSKVKVRDGYTLSCCGTYLKEPFIFFHAIHVKEEIPPPSINWVDIQRIYFRFI